VALALSCLAYGTRRAAPLAAHAHVLRVDHIVVKGTERLSSSDVLAVLSGLRGENLVRVNLGSWRDRLLSSPWIEDAALRRVLPSTVEVVVTERRPIGIGRAAGQMYLIDREGGMIDEYGPQYADLDLPVIDGLAVADGSGAADRPKAALAARVIGSLAERPTIARRLSQIDVHDPHNAAVILSGDPAVIELGDRAFLSRLQSYLELAPALRERVPEIDHVDLRFEGRIYVRPLEKAAKPEPVSRLLKR
jgi:cell division protein FtsQ